jgi:hypothetical protein
MKTACLLFLTMSWAALTHGIVYAALLRAEPALECGSGAAAFDWGASSAAGKAVAALPHSKARTFGPRPLAWGEGVARPAFSPAGARRVRGHSAPASPKVNRPKQVLISRKGSLAGNAMNLHQPGSDKSSGAAIGGLISGKGVNNRALVRPPSVVRPAVPLLNNVRHRGPNPAVVGGSLNSHGTNTGTINGTRMNHRM